ncbi:hypothetical protein SD70_16145 [Gordoniibacillus kamchatkensis]|uniref:Uncharacterized protein n=1 Tax=Gordoniibacillus kamchatkensis TaxID=1590651 RepID=A0ABR5AGV3_9BACL|nr:hypothetical protein [Paenibacillus sp. VKM B-2647]KIL40058.1 hypothetical protein SD70_16145 [Paenibacillus sp. VKM B-2647]
MKVQFKHLAAAMVLSASLLATVPALADDAQPSAQAAAASDSLTPASYDLGGGLQVQVLGVLSDKNFSGVRLGAAVRVINTNGDTVRIPDHELRLKTDDGLVYTLTPSAANVHGVPGGSQVDLTYLRQIDHKKDVKVTDLSLVDVNYDVYPKVETTLVSVPVGGQVWTGSSGTLTAPAALKAWGVPFAVPTLDSPLTYTPVSVSKSFTNQGASYLVKLRVDNASEQAETVPAFEVDGKTKTDSYRGIRAETGTVTVQPGDTAYIHYVINTEHDTELDSLNVLALEPFAVPDPSGTPKLTAFGVGKLNVALPKAAAGDTTAPAYQYGAPIAFEASNGFVNPNLQVSLVELHATDSVENGYRTAFAKLKLENKSDKPIPVPALQTELVSAGGTGGSYTAPGKRRRWRPSSRERARSCRTRSRCRRRKRAPPSR